MIDDSTKLINNKISVIWFGRCSQKWLVPMTTTKSDSTESLFRDWYTTHWNTTSLGSGRMCPQVGTNRDWWCAMDRNQQQKQHEWSVKFVNPFCAVLCVFKGPTLVRTYEHFAAARSTESGALTLFALDGQVFPTHSRSPKGKGWGLFYDLSDDTHNATEKHQHYGTGRWWGLRFGGGASLGYTFQSTR